MQEIKKIIEDYIVNKVKNSGSATAYRNPLVGYAAADAPIFALLPEVTHKGHLLPRDLLPTAKTVIAFFLPFSKETVRLNRKAEVSVEWALAYTETNALLYEICKGLKEILNQQGFSASFVEPTNNFDKTELVSQWSHKHVAYAAGLGKFGYNRQLITRVGCAGRFSSIVTDAVIVSEEKVTREYQYHICKQCGWCLKKACPVGALRENVWDKQLCWEKLQENERLVGLHLAQSCGKCVVGPCGIIDDQMSLADSIE